ncbi:hypothetical protein AK830_g2032 [Neonectria ditissima]|uniref:Tetracenomycin polyketide synthesis O-methyltransferase TcmP n=1 Tax=Neonectria ditissima TaxID=78410 RepID=A0A0P7BVV2_9HYPO|nr:hypothetical protein AK830_g2032 [Neonectria ditissima]
MSTQSDADTSPSRPSPPIQVALHGVAETLLISLSARSADARKPKPILGVQHAAGVVKCLDYDSSKYVMPETDMSAVALRAKLFDTWTASFLSSHPIATILHLGCGLDSRVQRLNWGCQVHWIDVDLPDAIALRRKVLPTSYTDRDYQLIGVDIREDAWLATINPDRPVAVVMEGFLSYLSLEEVSSLLTRLASHFKEGEMMFDGISSLVLSAGDRARPYAVRRTGADFQSAVDDPGLLERTYDGLSLLETIRFVEAPGIEKLPLGARFRMYILSWIPGLRDASRLFRFGFKNKISPDKGVETS